jgi:GMP synthase-like glutamine amidotransferase
MYTDLYSPIVPPEFEFQTYHVARDYAKQTDAAGQEQPNIPPLSLCHKLQCVIVSGSFRDVSDQLPWMKQLATFLQTVYTDYPHVKLYGGCFGHQFIAYALGGSVGKNPPEVGFNFKRQLLEVEDPDSKSSTLTLSIYKCHGYCVTALPNDAKRLATTSLCENESFAVGRRVLCFQGHPEFTPQVMNDYIFPHLNDEQRANAKHHVEPHDDGQAEEAQQFVRRFISS